MNDLFKIYDDFATAAKRLQQRMEFFTTEVTTLVEQATSFAQGNAAALVESARITAEGSSGLVKKAAEDVQRNAVTVTSAVEAALSGEFRAGLLTLPVNTACAGSDNVASGGSSFVRDCIKLAGDAAQPLVTQFQLAVNSAKATETA